MAPPRSSAPIEASNSCPGHRLSTTGLVLASALGSASGSALASGLALGLGLGSGAALPPGSGGAWGWARVRRLAGGAAVLGLPLRRSDRVVSATPHCRRG